MLVKNHQFESTPPVFGTRIVTLLEFHRDYWHQKTRVFGLLYGVVCVIIRLASLVQCRSVKDGWTSLISLLIINDVTAIMIVALSKTCRDAGTTLGQYNRQRRRQRRWDSCDAVLSETVVQ